MRKRKILLANKLIIAIVFTHIGKFDESAQKHRVAVNLAPHRICSYIYALANNFNSLYHDVKFLSLPEKEKESCMALLMLTFRVLSTCIHTLGFGAPERM